MKRVNYHLADQQVRKLKKMAKASGLNVADLIRRAIDDYEGPNTAFVARKRNQSMRSGKTKPGEMG